MASLNPLRKRLLDWYDENRRDLPWRRTRDPYRIWISEIMLQQTTVRTVEPRWRRFLERFPAVEALATAPLDDVLAEWSGLGYYARARNLHAAARRVVDDFGGEMPRSFEVLLALPGMGRYTAAAVASIAFDEAVAVLDANVERVVARLVAHPGDIRRAPVKRALWDRAGELLDPRRAGDWNQAMMELGAVVCLPAAPLCGQCPLAPWCKARESGAPERFPVKSPKPAMREVREAAVIVRRGDRVLVLQRPADVSFAHFWETPRVELAEGESARDGARRAARELAGLDIEPAREVLRLRHVVMSRKIELSVWEADHPGGRIRRSYHENHEWIDPAEWATRPISTTQKDIALFLSEGRQPAKAVKRRKTSRGEAVDMFDAEANEKC